jgi:predicted nuclease of predicted toxin-antitoxin system
MKILLDENLPAKLRFDFGEGYEIKTVQEMGWNGKKNGELLTLLNSNGFDMFVTMDKNIRHQQNLSRLPFTVFLLNAKDNKHQTIQPLVARTIEALQKGPAKGLVEVF